jgi:hypothetical protein
MIVLLLSLSLLTLYLCASQFSITEIITYKQKWFRSFGFVCFCPIALGLVVRPYIKAGTHGGEKLVHLMAKV